MVAWYVMSLAASIFLLVVPRFLLRSQLKVREGKYLAVLQAPDKEGALDAFRKLMLEMQPEKKGFTINSRPEKEPLPSSDLECYKLFHFHHVADASKSLASLKKLMLLIIVPIPLVLTGLLVLAARGSSAEIALGILLGIILAFSLWYLFSKVVVDLSQENLEMMIQVDEKLKGLLAASEEFDVSDLAYN